MQELVLGSLYFVLKLTQAREKKRIQKDIDESYGS